MSNPLIPEKPWIQLENKDIASFREKALKDQKGKCGICGTSHPDTVWVGDHSHAKGFGGTGLFRGVLCRNCNSLEGKIVRALRRFGVKIEHLADWLRNLANWLDKPHYPLIHPTEKPRIKLNKTQFKGLQEYVKLTYNRVIKYPIKGLLNKRQEEYYKEYKENND